MTNTNNEMCFVTPDLLRSIKKLEMSVTEEDGKYELNFTWDETDPDLKAWMSLTEEEQTNFVLSCLNQQIAINIKSVLEE